MAIPVNTYRPGGQFEPDLAVLDDGRLIVTWHSRFDETSGEFTYIAGQLFDVDGSRVGIERMLSTPLEWSDSARVAAMADGGFALVYESGGNTIFAAKDIYLRRFDEDAEPISDPLWVSPVREDFYFAVDVTAAGTGAYVSYTADNPLGPSGNEELWGAWVNGAGSFATAPGIVNQDSPWDQHDSRVVTLTNGDVIAIWNSEEGGTNEVGNSVDAVVGRRFGPDGLPKGAEFFITPDHSGASGTFKEAKTETGLAALPGGRFVASWYDVDTSGPDTRFWLEARIFNANGTPAGPVFRVNDGLEIPNHSSIAALEGGGFVITWNAWNPDGNRVFDDMFGQLFDAYGTPVGSVFGMTDDNIGNQERGEVAGLPDGGFAVVFEDERADDSDGGISLMRFEAPDQALGGLVAQGNANNNVLNGRYGADTLRGAIGQDTLHGKDGADLLQGGIMADRLWGNNGADRLEGGSGPDQLFAGFGADRLFGQKGADLLVGAQGADTLTGGLGPDTMTGGLGPDVFVFAPGGGRDRITDFGRGADRLDLRATEIETLGQLRAALSSEGANTRLTLDSGDTLLLIGVQPSEIGLADVWL